MTATGMTTVAVFRGATLVDEVPFTSKVLRVGRDPENDLVLPDDAKSVSRNHAELRAEKGNIVVQDLGSQNGTWVDGKRVSRATVRPGRDLVIGPYRLELREGNSSTQASPRTAPPVIGASGTQLLKPAPAAPQTAARRSAVADSPRRSGSRTVRLTQSFDGFARAVTRQQKTVAFASLAAIVVLALAVAAWQVLGRESVETPIVAEEPPVAPPPPTAEQIVADHVARARELVQSGDFESAIGRHLEPALEIDPHQTELAQLWTIAQVQADLKTRVVMDVPKPPVVAKNPQPAGEPLPDPALFPRLPAESDDDWRTRYTQVVQEYQRASERLAERDWVEASKLWADLATRYPLYRDTVKHLNESREGLRQTQQTALGAAQAFESHGDLLAAAGEYERAQSYGAADAAAKLVAVRNRIRTEVKDALTRARQYDSFRRVADATAQYERVVKLLPTGDPDRQEAEVALRRLRP